MNRREFLNHAWGASMALFMAEMGVVAYLYAMPRFREGESWRRLCHGGWTNASQAMETARGRLPRRVRILVSRREL